MKNIFKENKWDKIEKKKLQEAKLKKMREAAQKKEKAEKKQNYINRRKNVVRLTGGSFFTPGILLARWWVV